MEDDASRIEALKSLAVSQRKYDSGDSEGAERFCLKSISLFDTPEGRQLLDIIKSGKPRQSTSNNSSSPPSSEHPAKPQSSAPKSESRQRKSTAAASTNTSSASSTAAATPAQKTLVNSILKAKESDYYAHLQLEKSCSDSDVKKAYRRLALLLHPDKCAAPRADEAFKIVGKAFSVLSDGNKRAAFDRTGTDPDSRGGGGMRPSGGGGPGAGRQFQGGEVNAEDIFNMFFNGGQMGGGPGFTMQFGNGFQTRRTAPHNQTQGGQGQTSSWQALLPVFFLLLFTVLPLLTSLLSGPGVQDPSFSFAPTTYHTHKMSTANPRNPQVNFYVNPTAYNQHKVAKEKKAFTKFQTKIENSYVDSLRSNCQFFITEKERRIELQKGIFGFGTDWDAIKEIKKEQSDECAQLRKWGWRVEE